MKPLNALPLYLGCLLLWNAGASRAAETPGPTPQDRYVWTTFRLRDSGTLENRVYQNRRIIMLKLDTATGRIWQYNPESLTVDADGIKGELGFFTPLQVEGIPEPPPIEPAKKDDGDKKPAPPPPPPPLGRFAFLSTTMPRSVLSGTGEAAGVIEREEVFLTDRRTGHNWILDSRVETVKKDDKDAKITHNCFTRMFNADETQVVVPEKKEGPEEEPIYKLSKSLAEWIELFLDHRADKAPGPEVKASVDCAVILSRSGNVLPLVVLRKSLRDTKAVAVTPWQLELYSDKAVDYLCEQPAVEFEKAERFVIFINAAGKTAKGFNGLRNQAVNGLPEADKIGKVTRVQ